MQQRNRFAGLYRDWCVVGALACVISGFPSTPIGPLLLWAVILPALAAWLLWERPSERPARRMRIHSPQTLPRQAWRRPRSAAAADSSQHG